MRAIGLMLCGLTMLLGGCQTGRISSQETRFVQVCVEPAPVDEGLRLSMAERIAAGDEVMREAATAWLLDRDRMRACPPPPPT